MRTGEFWAIQEIRDLRTPALRLNARSTRLAAQTISLGVFKTAIDLRPFVRLPGSRGKGPLTTTLGLLGLLLYAYASGVRSLRQVQRRCTEDLAFRVLSGSQLPTM
jgi:hypothetical protein